MKKAPASTIPRVVVVIAAFVAQLILEGTVLALDVLPPYIIRYFHSTNAEVTLFGAVVHGFSHLLGPVSSIIANRFGDRHLVMFCGLLAALGFLLGSLSLQVWHLVLACGLVGIAFGLCWVPPVTVVSFHFTKRRNIVTSGTTIGGAVGGAVAPFLLQYLLDYHPWQHCFTFLACMVIQLTVCGALLVRPKVSDDDEDSLAQRRRTTSGHFMEDISEADLKRIQQLRTREKFAPILQKLALPVLMVCNFVWHVGYDSFEIMPLRLTDENFESHVIPIVISLHAVFDIFGRLAAALMVGRADQTLTYNVFLIVGGVCRVLLSWPGTLVVYLIYISVSGFCFGVVKAAAPSVLLELVGVHRLNVAFGFWLFTSGMGGMCGPPLAGFLSDLSHLDYFPPFFTGGILVLAASLPMLVYHWPLKKLFTKK